MHPLECGGGFEIGEVHDIRRARSLCHELSEGSTIEFCERSQQPAQTNLRDGASRQWGGLDGHAGGRGRQRIIPLGAHHPAFDAARGQPHEQGGCASRGRGALRVWVVRHHYEDTQGCESMTHMVTKVAALTRGLLSGGAAGDAGVARGRRMASNVGVQFVARGIAMVLGVVTVSLTARTLGATEYGVWNGVGSYVGLFGVLTDLGFATAATQRMAAEPEREAEWLAALVGVRVTMSVVVTRLCAASIPLVLTSSDDSHAVGYILARRCSRAARPR